MTRSACDPSGYGVPPFRRSESRPTEVGTTYTRARVRSAAFTRSGLGPTEVGTTYTRARVRSAAFTRSGLGPTEVGTTYTRVRVRSPAFTRSGLGPDKSGTPYTRVRVWSPAFQAVGRVELRRDPPSGQNAHKTSPGRICHSNTPRFPSETTQPSPPGLPYPQSCQPNTPRFPSEGSAMAARRLTVESRPHSLPLQHAVPMGRRVSGDVGGVSRGHFRREWPTGTHGRFSRPYGTPERGTPVVPGLRPGLFSVLKFGRVGILGPGE
jgi:hypothetical protein